MTLYKGRAQNQTEKQREEWKAYARALHIEAGGSRFDEFNPDYGKDDGRGDEPAPDSGWVEGFNRSQRGES